MKKFKYGDRLKDLRKPIGDKSKHLSMDALCDIFTDEYGLSVNKSMVSRWENGTAVPDNKHIVAYAKYFNTDMNYLIGLTDVKQRLTDVTLGTSEESNLSEIINELNKLPESKVPLFKEILITIKELDDEKIKGYVTILKQII